MRIVIIILLFVLLLWTILHPIIKSKTTPSIFWVSSIALILLVTVGFEVRWLYVQYKATELVQQVSQNSKGYAECQRFSQGFTDAQSSVLGSVSYSEGNKANIKYYQCQYWADVIFSDKTNLTDKQLWAIGTIIHEGYHVSGEYNEATTQCLTIKHFPEHLKYIGVPDNKIEEYAAKQKEMSKGMDAKYLNGVC